MRVAEQFSEHATSLPRPVQVRTRCAASCLTACKGLAASCITTPVDDACAVNLECCLAAAQHCSKGIASRSAPQVPGLRQGSSSSSFTHSHRCPEPPSSPQA